MDSEHCPIPISRHGHNAVMGFPGTAGVVRVPPQSPAATPAVCTSSHRAPARSLK